VATPWPRPRDVRLVFGLRPVDAVAPNIDAPSVSDLDVSSLAHLGFPGLSVAVTFLSKETTELWNESRTLRFAGACCVCREPATRYLPTVEAHGLLFPKLRPGALATCVPHCDAHATQDHALLLVSVDRWNEAATHVAIVGLNRAFIEEARDLNRQGDPFPPWRAFPDYSPETSGWRQGTGEYWWHSAWRPFWSKLTSAERQEYLRR
jgi:hypothetical protein